MKLRKLLALSLILVYALLASEGCMIARGVTKGVSKGVGAVVKTTGKIVGTTVKTVTKPLR